MKKELLNPTLLLTAALGTAFLTGCASMDRGYTESTGNGAMSAVAFTTVTDPRQLVKWTGDKFLMNSLRSVDTYTFQVPYTGVAAGNEYAIGDAPASARQYPEGLGGTAREGYQSETGSYRTILYRPGIGR
jgi:hypothetical protein